MEQHLLRTFEQKLDQYSEEDKREILKSAEFSRRLHAEQKRLSGEPYFIHPLKVAEILLSLKLDAHTIMAAFLHDVLEDTPVSRVDLRKEFGKEVEALVNGVTKISQFQGQSKSVQEAESIRKMLFAMTKDIRVILIKLADKLHNMTTLDFIAEPRRKEIASECLDIYAPLAGRLGISWMKAELEDLSLKHLQPMVYQQIKEFVAQKKNLRGEYLARIKKEIIDSCHAEKITVDVSARAKHFYSIYKKMKMRSKKIDEIYDLLGIRILCSTVTECYTILGLVHRLWIPIEGRFKDYIAMPKANKYQSLHTTVMGYDGKLIEMQIRTGEMHQTAEYGIAAHWLYKRGASNEIVNTDHLAIINKLKTWNGVKLKSQEFLEEIKQELLKDSIYLFTPLGDVVELPKGATALDFAYHIHTEVGNHCVSAKADSVIIPLSRELKNTQVIEIQTSQQARPHVNWLRIVKSPRSRAKIRQWLNKHDDSLIIDKSVVAKKAPVEQTPKQQPSSSPASMSTYESGKTAFKINGEKNVLIRLAKCCNPMIGDNIIGFVSRGRGIIVHRADCTNLVHIADFTDRKISVEWETVSPRALIKMKLTSRRTNDLFSEIENAIRKHKGHLIEGRLEENEKGYINGFFTIELEHKNDTDRVLKNIRNIPNVFNIQIQDKRILGGEQEENQDARAEHHED